MAEGKPFYSFEFFPPKTREGVENLYERLDRMSSLEPLFMDLTWGAGGTTAALTLEISGNAQSLSSAEIMMHLTCTNMPREMITEALDKAKKLGIRNILALRGDPPRGAESWEQCENGFAHALDLVKFIRQEHGDYFGIAVAGYPEGHITAESIDSDIAHLKAKCDAGADFIVTQLFYDVDIYLQWVKKCRDAGIQLPIVPGIMPIQNYSGFKRMTGFCKTAVPKEIEDAIEPIKHDDAKVKSYGIELGIQMCRKLLAAGSPGLHFYTLNLERSVNNILEGLGFVTPKQSGRLPWKQSQVARRQKEDVRPIFWANRPQAYFDRTAHWDEFPNGRWGPRDSPAFGELSDHHLMGLRVGSAEERRKIWATSIEAPIHVFQTFARYIEGECPRLPWCENQVLLETIPLKQTLKRLNEHGILTINSQPKVNGAPSNDPAVGWGGEGGYVYQKSYLEFFTSVTMLEKLVKLAAEHPNLTYTAVDVRGKTVTNIGLGEKTVNAVTWGVFPNKEIIQPTIVDVDSFMAWKDEAFALWLSQWASAYEPDSKSSEVIREIHDTYFLVNVVDNDFVKSDMFAIFEKLLL